MAPQILRHGQYIACVARSVFSPFRRPDYFHFSFLYLSVVLPFISSSDIVGQCFKGIESRDEYVLKAYNNKWVLSVHALIVFIFFCFLLHEKIEL